MKPAEIERLMAALHDHIEEIVYLYGEVDRDEVEQALNGWDRENYEQDHAEPHAG